MSEAAVPAALGFVPLLVVEGMAGSSGPKNKRQKREKQNEAGQKVTSGHIVVACSSLATGNQYEYFPIVATFIAGYAVIVLEEQTEINKAATALVLGVPWLESYAPASSDLRDLGESTGLEATQ